MPRTADRFRILRRCSLKHSRSRLPVSPMYRQLQRRQEMQHTTFSNWQLKWSRMLCALFGPCTNVWEAMCLHATRPPTGQWTGISDQWHRRSVQGYHRGFARVDMIRAGVRGKSRVPRDRRTRCWNCQARSVWCRRWMRYQQDFGISAFIVAGWC